MPDHPVQGLQDGPRTPLGHPVRHRGALRHPAQELVVPERLRLLRAGPVQERAQLVRDVVGQVRRLAAADPLSEGAQGGLGQGLRRLRRDARPGGHLVVELQLSHAPSFPSRRPRGYPQPPAANGPAAGVARPLAYVPIRRGSIRVAAGPVSCQNSFGNWATESSYSFALTASRRVSSTADTPMFGRLQVHRGALLHPLEELGELERFGVLVGFA